MDKTTAQRLVRETFKAPFDRKRYRDFINELCNGIDESRAISSMGVPDAFADHIKSCQRLGTFTSPDGELTDVLVVQLTESFKLERTRTALRDFVAHKLKRDESYKEAGLVAFVAPDAQSWRFSYVRMEYETRRDPRTGRIKPEERLTPARRYSYLVGAEEECHTAQSRFLALLQNTSDKPTLADLEEAFSVESVTEEFFREYVRLFEDTEAALAAVVQRDKRVRDDFAAKGVTTVDFAKKLLGQIVFLYFIQKKGWLGVEKGGRWGDGRKDFMRWLAGKAVREGRCLFNDVLEPLFYDTLATDRGHEAWCKIFACRIPFLNGGLFEPLAGYEWEKTGIDLPNTLFTNTTRSAAGDTGSGILDVLDRYNFTVNEAEPLEKEVAIDPEMLGKVFENLIEDNRRKGLGAFYTPREIVHFMCQESLINYLDTRLGSAPAPGVAGRAPASGSGGADEGVHPHTRGACATQIPRADLETWIRQSDQFAHYAAAGVAGARYAKPPDSIRQCAHEIDVLLRDITVCDPAIGSGAFPVGMMMEIVRARLALTPWFNDVAERTAYHFKRHVIQSSLYGVDIDAGAVEIAKLRLWLSLVVDEDDVQQIKPLPNLDYKIVVGNSLLGFPFKSQRVQKIETLKTSYFDETNHDRKVKLRREIDTELALAFASSKASLGYEVTFDFQIHFSEVFRSNKGFDVVIANPPYVRQEAIKDIKPALKSGGYECFTGTADLLVYFYERAVKLLRGGGCIAFITSNKFYRAGYGEKLRGFLARELTLHRLIDFGDAPVFEAIAYASILVGVRAAPAPEASALAYTWEKELMTFERIAQIVPERGQQILQSELKPDGWRLESPAVLRLLEKLRRAGKPLGEYVGGRFYRGILTGLNEAFVVDRATRDRLIREHKSSAAVLKPYLRGRDVKRWRTEFAEQYLIKIESSENKEHPWSGKSEKEAEKIFAASYPAIHEWLEQFRSALKTRSDQGNYFWELRSCAYWKEFEQPKLVVPAISGTVNVSLDNEGYFSNNKTSIFVCPDAAFVSAIVNSKVALWFTRQVFATKQGGFYDFEPRYSSQWPIPAATPAQQKPVERLVERILAAKQRDAGADVSALEREIDAAVHALYALTPEEIQLVEGTAK